MKVHFWHTQRPLILSSSEFEKHQTSWLIRIHDLLVLRIICRVNSTLAETVRSHFVQFYQIFIHSESFHTQANLQSRVSKNFGLRDFIVLRKFLRPIPVKFRILWIFGSFAEFWSINLSTRSYEMEFGVEKNIRKVIPQKRHHNGSVQSKGRKDHLKSK